MTPEQIICIAGQSEPVQIMQFTLIFDGDLPAGNNQRALYASKIRNQLHDQLADLWESHVVMRKLARKARAYDIEGSVFDLALEDKGKQSDEYTGPIPPLEKDEIDLCGPVAVERIGLFRPIVRKSLHLACSLDILFLRHEEPMHLFNQGGDLDNRIKCFFDGLKMPDPLERGVEYSGEALTQEPLCVLLEDDKWISDFSVKTGRLLGRGEKKRHAVRITANIRIKVLRVNDHNLCLVGDDA